MGKTIQQLRTMCNARGISCRGPAGGYLGRSTLLKKLGQQGGADGLDFNKIDLGLDLDEIVNERVFEGLVSQAVSERQLMEAIPNILLDYGIRSPSISISPARTVRGHRANFVKVDHAGKLNANIVRRIRTDISNLLGDDLLLED